MKNFRYSFSIDDKADEHSLNDDTGQYQLEGWEGAIVYAFNRVFPEIEVWMDEMSEQIAWSAFTSHYARIASFQEADLIANEISRYMLGADPIEEHWINQVHELTGLLERDSASAQWECIIGQSSEIWPDSIDLFTRIQPQAAILAGVKEALQVQIKKLQKIEE
jgi:hypothetical protein